VVLLVALHGKIVDNGVALDVGRGRAILHDDRRTVQVNAVVDDQERVIVVDDIIVHADTIQVLLQQVFEEEVLLLQSRLLLLNGELVEMHLVVALVEAVQLLELVVGAGANALNLLNHLV